MSRADTALLAQLRACVSEAQVLTAPEDMAPYLTDWRGRYQGQALAVVRPGSTEEVAAVVCACVAAQVAVVPQGGNTGLCGGATPLATGRSIVLSLARLNRIREVDADNFTLTAEAGCSLWQVQQAAAQQQRLFPLSLASEGSCTVGGNLSTNAGGVHVLRYGNTRDLTLGLEVVLPDGRIWQGLRALRKDNTGYDLKHLFIGAEGTLGIITAAVFKLWPAQQARATAWFAVPDVAAAVRVLGRLRQHCGERLTAFELVSRVALNLVLQHIPQSQDPLPDTTTPWYVLVELLDGGTAESLQEQLAQLLDSAMQAGDVLDAVLAQSEAQAVALWALRETISEAQKREGISIKHDVAVPVSRVPEFLSRAEQQLAEAFPGVRIVAFGHLGDGNLHYNLSKVLGGDNAEFIAHTPAVNQLVHDLVYQLHGTISAEHGLGQLKRAENQRYKSTVELDMMRAIKASFDPLGLFNPGKVL